MRAINKLILFYIIFVLILFINIVYAQEFGNINNNLESTNIVQKNTEKQISNEEKINEIKIKDVNEINKTNTIIIQALNKITAKSYEYEIKIGDSITFERIIIKPLFCWKSSPSKIPENKALIKIVEKKLNKKQEEIFYGWMFSSSPSISSLEHPMYDIRVVNCKNINEEEEK